jgi:c(7)-type cytochrome triheme protein
MAACTFAAALVWANHWLPLALDGLHDPDAPGTRLLQQPGEALSLLPPDTAGNMVRWVNALESGAIRPRTSLFETTEVRILDLDVIMPNTSDMPMVRFPHGVHTAWLDCGNCHDKIFAQKAGATPVNMFAILQGEYCGRCHGAVSFPLTECKRCHSVPWKR